MPRKTPTKKIAAKTATKPATKSKKRAAPAKLKAGGAKVVKITSAKRKIAAKPKAKAPTTKGKVMPFKKNAAPQAQGSTALWKFLEMKEAQRKMHQEQNQNDKRFGGRDANPHKQQGFGRFAGPRRRAA